jgi:hypothetical protein
LKNPARRRTFTRTLLAVIAGAAIVAASFFGTLFVLNFMDSRTRDAQRKEDLKILRSALDQYRAARGGYPAPFPDNSVDDLKAALVDGGFLKSIPRDPLPPRIYRYTSYGVTDGQRYGLRISTERESDCITGIGFEGRGWWGPYPSCPF